MIFSITWKASIMDMNMVKIWLFIIPPSNFWWVLQADWNDAIQRLVNGRPLVKIKANRAQDNKFNAHWTIGKGNKLQHVFVLAYMTRLAIMCVVTWWKRYPHLLHIPKGQVKLQLEFLIIAYITQINLVHAQCGNWHMPTQLTLRSNLGIKISSTYIPNVLIKVLRNHFSQLKKSTSHIKLKLLFLAIVI